MSFRDREGPPLPKPYDFVPLPGRGRGQQPAGHHRYDSQNYSGRLTATVIARSPVHVASGLLEKSGNRKHPLVKAHFRTGGQPAIPGTSLKGCIRSIVEAITSSSVQVAQRMRNIPEDYRPAQLNPERNQITLDVAQRIFGAQGYQGMVCFRDAVLITGTTVPVTSPQLFRPRSDQADIYFDGRQPRGRKFYMHGEPAEGNLPLEACDKGSRFELRMEFANLAAGEIGLLLVALGLGERRFCPKLGGAKPACLGTIEISEPKLLACRGGDLYDAFDATPQPVDLPPFLQAATKLVERDQLKKLAEVLCWPREDGRECPDRSY